MEAFLPEVVYLGYPRCRQKAQAASAVPARRAARGAEGGRRTAAGQDAVGAALVPQLRCLRFPWFLGATRGPGVSTARAELWGGGAYEFDGNGRRIQEIRSWQASRCEAGGRTGVRRGRDGPSKMTPKEPSPIFFPTR